MSTPNPVFTPLTKGFSWAPSTTGNSGQPVPSGESFASSTLGIRADGDASHAAGNYQYLVVVPAPTASETVAALTSALTKSLAPGNYWAAVDQTDIMAGQSYTSSWSAEVPFSIPPQAVVPDQPTALAVS